MLCQKAFKKRNAAYRSGALDGDNRDIWATVSRVNSVSGKCTGLGSVWHKMDNSKCQHKKTLWYLKWCRFRSCMIICSDKMNILSFRQKSHVDRAHELPNFPTHTCHCRDIFTPIYIPIRNLITILECIDCERDESLCGLCALSLCPTLRKKFSYINILKKKIICSHSFISWLWLHSE